MRLQKGFLGDEEVKKTSGSWMPRNSEAVSQFKIPTKRSSDRAL